MTSLYWKLTLTLCFSPLVFLYTLQDQKSVSVKATMTYFLKPLTYNSQIAGYLIRCYPGKWTTIDAVSKQILGSFDDDEILVGNSNTPDLRESGRLVQKSVYTRAIHARRG